MDGPALALAIAIDEVVKAREALSIAEGQRDSATQACAQWEADNQRLRSENQRLRLEAQAIRKALAGAERLEAENARLRSELAEAMEWAFDPDLPGKASLR